MSTSSISCEQTDRWSWFSTTIES